MESFESIAALGIHFAFTFGGMHRLQNNHRISRLDRPLRRGAPPRVAQIPRPTSSSVPLDDGSPSGSQQSSSSSRDDEQGVLPSTLGWGSAAFGAAGFCVIALDVFGPGSLHLLEPLDKAGHELAQSLDPSAREFLFRLCVSDAAIAAGWYWYLLSMIALLKPKHASHRPCMSRFPEEDEMGDEMS